LKRKITKQKHKHNLQANKLRKRKWPVKKKENYTVLKELQQIYINQTEKYGKKVAKDAKKKITKTKKNKKTTSFK
jgi:hypothetical protein